MTREELAARLYTEAADLLLEARSEESKRLGKEYWEAKKRYLASGVDADIRKKRDELFRKKSNGEITNDEYDQKIKELLEPTREHMALYQAARSAALNSPKEKAAWEIELQARQARGKREKRKKELLKQIRQRRYENDPLYRATIDLERAKKEAKERAEKEAKERAEAERRAREKEEWNRRRDKEAPENAKSRRRKAEEDYEYYALYKRIRDSAAEDAEKKARLTKAGAIGAGVGLTAAGVAALKNKKAIAANIAGRKDAKNIIKNSDIKSLENHISKLEKLIADYEAQPSSEKNAQATATYKKAKVTLKRLHKAYKNMLKQKAATESAFDQLDDSYSLYLEDFD